MGVARVEDRQKQIHVEILGFVHVDLELRALASVACVPAHVDGFDAVMCPPGTALRGFDPVMPAITASSASRSCLLG